MQPKRIKQSPARRKAPSLHITERKHAEELKERARLSAFAADVSLSLIGNQPLGHLLQRCTEAVVNQLGLAFSRIWVLGPADLCKRCHKSQYCENHAECLHLQGSAGLSTNLHGEYSRVPLGALKIGRIAQTACAMTTNDILHDDRLQNKQWMRDNGLRSFAGYPLVVEGKVYGVLGAFGREAFSPTTLQTLEFVCRSLATAIARKQALDIQQASEAFAHEVLNSLSSHVCVLDKDGVIVKTNDAWKEFARRNSNGTVCLDVGENYLDVCRRAIISGDRSSEAILDNIEAVLAGSLPSFSAEYPCHSSHEERWFLMRVTPLQGAGGVVISHVNITEQVGMRVALKQHALLLRDNQEKLEFLSGKLIEAQDQERRRIACDLHDDVSQRLAALVLDVAAIQQHTGVLEGVPDALKPVRERLERLSDDVHNLAYQLHPSLLEHAGLQPAIEDHIEQISKRTGLSIVLQARKVPGSLTLDRSTCLFRVLQESLHNIVKHANATEAMVKLSGSSRGVGVSVMDNGKGFDVADKIAHHKGLGLISMQERLRGLNGFLRIHSRPADGTKVCAWIPASRADA